METVTHPHTAVDWYRVRNMDTVDTPALLVYPERIQENIRLLKNAVNGEVDSLRPHVKTHKMAEVCRLMLAAGIRKFKCATIAEAEMLAQAGAPDVLLAYQPVGPKIARLLRLVQKYPATQFSCLLDNPANARAVSEVFDAAGIQLPVFMDLNVGMNRTGIRPGAGALDLYRLCSQLPGLRAVGLHAYDGHIRDTDLATRQAKADLAFEPVAALAKEIERETKVAPVVVVGGSPSFPVHARRPGVERSPGTFIFWDWGYRQALPELPFVFAALVACRVISIIDAQTLCLDLGHKSVAAENPQPRVFFLNAPEAQPVSQSEEHLVVKVPDSAAYQVGEVFYGVPFHICPTCALYDFAQVVEDEQVSTQWRVVARDRRIAI